MLLDECKVGRKIEKFEYNILNILRFKFLMTDLFGGWREETVRKTSFFE